MTFGLSAYSTVMSQLIRVSVSHPVSFFISVCSKCVYNLLKSPQSSRQYVSLLQVRSRFKLHVKHQNVKYEKYFFGDILSADFQQISLRVRQNYHEKFLKKSIVCRSRDSVMKLTHTTQVVRVVMTNYVMQVCM